MEVTIKKEYKSLKNLTTFHVPNFCVLTGKNGSGKTHLFEALMSNGHAKVADDTGKQLTKIKYVPFNGLNPVVNSVCNYNDLMNQRKVIWQRISNAIQDASKGGVIRNLLSYIHESSIKKLCKELLDEVGGDISKLTEARCNQKFDLENGDSTAIFTSEFAAVFKLYHARLEENRYYDFRNREYGENRPVISDTEFEEMYGPKPWDLINRMMQDAHLPYTVNNPEGQGKEDDFTLHLEDKTRGLEIDVNDLSTGEKVLMSLALAIYNTSDEGHRPDLLLLDEPDAALNPEFSKVLIDAIENSLVKRAGINVIITTHSPATVAMADETYIYIMNKGEGIPKKVTKHEAVGALTRDIRNLRVAVEDRRQVFVENGNDVGYYEKIFDFLNKKFPTTPYFLAPHNKNGCNCDDVQNITKLLRDKGNDTVYGIIDFDNNKESGEFVFVLGNGNRYAIDNYILDPIYIILLLINENAVPEEAPDCVKCTFRKFAELSQEQIQPAIDSIVKQLGFDITQERVEYVLLNGMAFTVPKSFFEYNGHELEKKIIDTWPKLNGVKRGKNEEKIFKNYMLDTIISEYPEYLSYDFIETFGRLR